MTVELNKPRVTADTVETAEMHPEKAWYANDMAHVTLADSRTIGTPIWWYPYLSGLSDAQLDDIGLMSEGIWWRAVDEGISITSMFLGVKSPGAKPPSIAAE